MVRGTYTLLLQFHRPLGNHAAIDFRTEILKLAQLEKYCLTYFFLLVFVIVLA